MAWMHNQSYSQVGEDLIARTLLGKARNVTYIDIGCLWPVQFSNTYLFYTLGGSGLCIDANPNLADAYVKERPRDIFICGAVSNVERTLSYTMYESAVFNTVEQARQESRGSRAEPGQRVVGETEIPAKPLGMILDGVGWWDKFSQLDLLSVDVEGHELEVLESVPFERLAPSVVICEAIGSPEEIIGASLVEYVSARGYDLVAVTGQDCFFRSKRLRR